MIKKTKITFSLLSLLIIGCKSNIFGEYQNVGKTPIEIAEEDIREGRYDEAQKTLRMLHQQDDSNDQVKEFLVSAILKANKIDLSQLLTQELLDGDLAKRKIVPQEEIQKILEKLPSGNEKAYKASEEAYNLVKSIESIPKIT